MLRIISLNGEAAGIATIWTDRDPTDNPTANRQY